MVAQRADAGMGGEDGGARECRGLQHGVAGYVGDVDQHAEAVELDYCGSAEGAQAAVFGLGVAEVLAGIAGIGQCVVAVVGECQVARA